MSNLKFLLNDKTLNYEALAPSSEATGFEAVNLFSGYRGAWWKSETETTSHDIYLELGAGNGAIDTIYIGNANWFKADAPDAAIEAYESDDGVAWAEIVVDTTVELCGPHLTDWIYHSAGRGLSADCYFDLVLAGSDDFTAEIGKLYVGEAFDPGRDPSKMVITRRRTVYASKPVYRFALEYVDLSYTKASEMMELICKRADWHPFVIFTEANHGPLLDMECVLVRVIEWNAPQEITNRNNFSLTLEEII
jgi:hypothetical protein